MSPVGGDKQRCSTMGIETRNGRAYYYRKRRVGRRVVSEYVGGGSVGELAAFIDEVDRAERQEKREKWRAERQRQDDLDSQVDQVCAAVRAAVAEELEQAGFHKHKGQWRKRHD